MSELPLSVLLIEDNPGDVRLIREMIQDHSIQLISVDRLSSALARVSQGGLDAVLLDLSLPDSQGLETLKRLRAAMPRDPIVVLTGLEDETLGIQVVQEGAQDYLVKSQVNRQLLVRSLRYAIERQRSEQALRRRVRELAVLHDIATAGVEISDENVLIERATQIIDAGLIPDNLGVLLLDEVSGQLTLHSSYRGKELPRQMTIPLGRGVTGRVAADGRPRRIGDIRHEPDYVQLVPDIQSELCVPLKIGERIIGVINIESAQRDAFTDEDEQLMSTLAGQLATAIDRLRAEMQVRRLATIDELTGLFNRRHFFELGTRELERARRFGHSLAVVMLDIDHFKQVNDTYGHAVGDQVLRALAECCRKCIRGIDLLGRYGGEEFSILLVETDLEKGTLVTERLRANVEQMLVPTLRGDLRLTVSLGAVQAKASNSDFATLLDRADTAMYTAKQQGRNRVVWAERMNE